MEITMKRFLRIAVGLMVMLGITLSLQPLKAQVYGEFDTIRIRIGVPYKELPDAKQVIPPATFGLPPMWTPDLDDGYSSPTGIEIGFPYEFNGEVYTRLWICVNGFVTFSPPPFVPSKQPNGLFIDAVSYPKNVIAPFWGDHVFRQLSERFNGYMPSEISVLREDSVFTVQWKNLNINDGTVKSSVGNFQLKLYRSKDPLSFQGDIEFCYGPVAGNIYDPGTIVVTKGASVGLKGEFNVQGGYSDFLNGLFYGKAPFEARTKRDLTNLWPPSDGATDRRIWFRALSRFNIDEWWGDGDVDFSKANPNRHLGMDQSRWVTVNDARIIMRSVATYTPLDSVRRRQAYHGDVNHNGRYYYDNNNVRKDIPWRDKYYGDNLPTEISSIRSVFYQCNEYDAAMILHYISARLPELPWLLDTIPQYGKIGADEIANGFKFGNASVISENTYRIPVYLNGYIKGAIGGKFKVNGELVDAASSGNVLVEYFGNNVVIAGSDEFDAQTPVCYLTVKTKNPELSVSDIRFNDVKVDDCKTMLLTVEDDLNSALVSNYPNPFSYKTSFNLNLPKAGNYKLVVVDAIGNTIKTLLDGYANAGNSVVDWDGTNQFGNKVESGMYLFKLTGDNVTVSGKLVINR